MSFKRIKAVLLQEYYITLKSMEIIMDIFFFPGMSIILFGFLSVYLSATNPEAGKTVLMGMLLWQVIFITQYSVSVGSLWNIWSRNLSNMFIAPLSISEYVFAHTVSGIFKSLLIFVSTSVLSIFVFDFNIFTLGLVNLVLLYSNLIIFAVAVGLAILGLIFAYGTRIQAFAWGLLPLFQPLTAALYPARILPTPLKELSYIFPPTYVFEAARGTIAGAGMNWNFIIIAFVINALYLVGGILFFKSMFKKSRESGQFARNEG